MNTHIIKIGIFLSVFPLMVFGEDDRPIWKESPKKLVAVIESLAGENVEMAQISVAHDVARKRLRIFTADATLAGDTNIFGFGLEIVFVPYAAAYKSGVASYRLQHNNQILSFAAAQFASGNTAFAKRLVSILSEAEPGLFWSSPTDPVITIKQIRAGLEKDDNSVKPFIKDESQEWAKTVKRFGP